ncbi:Uma2 family endonuclease [Virgibacillus sp. FSP13]
MSLPEERNFTVDEFYKQRENSDQIMEYIDGMIFMSPSPSTKHQRISGRLHAQLFQLLEGSECEVFHAPFDVELNQTEMDSTTIVIPDLSVICDIEGLNEEKYVGVPTIIIEIVSPSNQSHDLVFKLNLYMQCGVKEYWIVNPLLHTIQVYTLDENKQYRLHDIAKDKGRIHSTILSKFIVEAEKIFA